MCQSNTYFQHLMVLYPFVIFIVHMAKMFSFVVVFLFDICLIFSDTSVTKTSHLVLRVVFLCTLPVDFLSRCLQLLLSSLRVGQRPSV